MKNDSQPTFIEVCAGAGGLSSGLIKAGFVPLMLNEIDKNCCETLRKNHPGVNIESTSMTELDFTKYAHSVDLFTGGVPCQSFSQAGLRKGLDDPRGNLILRFIEILQQIQPKIFMIENVKGLLTHENGQTLKQILNLIHGYNIEYKCLNAAFYGVPQKRERVFIIGTRIDLNLQHPFQFLIKNQTLSILKDVLVDVPASPGATYSEDKIRLFKMIPPGGCWVNLSEDLQKEYLGKSFESGGGKRGILHRCSMEQPCLTLLCSPSQKQTERCHPTEERPLTIREYARIQTFTDEYVFVGSKAAQYKQIGNAVPVEMAYRIGCAIKTVLVQ